MTVNFLGLFFRTGKIFFGLTRSSCLSVRMTDNFSASFGKSGNVNVTNDILPRKHPASGQSKLSDYKCNKIQVDHDAIEIISNEKILSTAYIVCVSK